MLFETVIRDAIVEHLERYEIMNWSRILNMGFGKVVPALAIYCSF